MKKKARNYWFILISIVMTLGFANSFAETLPVLNIKGNGQSGQVSLMPNDNLSVKLDIDPGTFAGIKADWWLVAKTPSGDWYSWVYPTPSCIHKLQSPISLIPLYQIVTPVRHTYPHPVSYR